MRTCTYVRIRSHVDVQALCRERLLTFIEFQARAQERDDLVRACGRE